ncbi:unnamed protein product [Blumeria hordei]|uniref:Uncharacterized protein n=1 Tax=Blumeria hordei TaxID=2867405 RepID=A0A383UMH1_BLUHO|nr:unnamed protein product [Blumeria hordei]
MNQSGIEFGFENALRTSYEKLAVSCLSIAATSSSNPSITSPPRSGKSSFDSIFLFFALPIVGANPYELEVDRLERRSDPIAGGVNDKLA